MSNSSALRVLTDPRPEVLAAALARELSAAPLPNPFALEWIFVPHAGTQTWLDYYLAQALGIWAQGRLLHPREALWRLARMALAEMPDRIALEPQQTVWLIFESIERLCADPAFSAFKTWLEAAPAQNRAWSLAQEWARQIDLIATFRPDWLPEFEAGRWPLPEAEWAGKLWQELLKSLPAPIWHRGALQQLFIRRLRSGAVSPKRLPRRLSVFGLSELPSFYLEILLALAEVVPTTLYLPSPLPPLEGLVLRETCGEQEQIWVSALASRGVVFEALPETLPEPQNLLQALQAALRKPGDCPLWPGPDTSIQIHSVHSPQRELEVLKDFLFACFDELPELKPSEIAVLIPDLAVYAPLVAGVFGSGGQQGGRLPFALVQPDFNQNPGVLALRSLFELSSSRLSLDEVWALLEQPAVSRAFGLQPEDLELAIFWLDQVEVRWGRDAEHRRKLGLPAFSQNSWQQGLQRLLLGMALDDQGQLPYAGILPYGPMEGQNVRILGRLLDFFSTLEKALDALVSEKTASEWSETLSEILLRLVKPLPEQEDDWFLFLEQLQKLAEIETLYAPPLGLGLLRTQLETLWSHVPERPLPLGRILFASPARLQGLPFRVICFLGLNAGVLPRADQTTELDLLALSPRSEDPSLRRADRDLFLTVLRSAGERFYLSYTGRRVRDNLDLPASVLVSELQDSLQALCGQTVPVTRHPLQPFDPRYFKAGTGVRSWSWQALKEAQNLQLPPQAHAFVDGPLPALVPGPTPWQALLDFFRHPAKAFLMQRLDLRLRREEQTRATSERFQLNGLERFQLRETFLTWLLQGGSPAVFDARLRARGHLPPGPVGEQIWLSLQAEILPLAQSLQVLTGVPQASRSFRFDVEAWQLEGQLQPLFSEGLIQVRLSRLKAADYLQTWLEHLLLACLGEAQPVRRVGFEKDQGVLLSFAPVEQPQAELKRLLDLYDQGLNAPLPLALESAWAWVSELNKGIEKAQRKAAQRWYGNQQQPGEASDAAYALCLAPDWLRAPETEALILEIFGPLRQHLRQVSLQAALAASV
ncbi:hypothetical protein COW36_22410 [bacterium (Candidatus Blackallbacteria) CG17_big_fil_post_rev_8_21_14_2_50_48_46]|uniref:RecC C-terminal domain-containing protein n=1 Tax=bacterium (Candidatus Blackallbacteria) CG17_big_fil_post_rev_8_21_14_2_50_48_46 TaxID=2014261 RepID=A0A2M7FYI4_9BACT|nr:MAG: hypothetical protein COW64_05755 [bacterium (Candidatus Blackallbacteria) CG18_big_fil_WC_8_21_14_2_50_49_26]PIW14225.1 MAG: hypothetical protein COW36_22410 [bacterium (Candidatus Blackallbacteria) CG17_big_fil_post_rev_8_21_14_2_50_48_46]PIW46970.1 MAG: hypothetical protein COW20_14080 [bacterium (Candidatus Blackallbacteria) CG13_big_fil_rev_8_21_14_2_50_49_14]